MNTPTRAASRKFILRPYRRIPTWYQAYYMTGESVGKGVVMNLSCSGMRMLGDHSLKPGMELTVRFTVEDDRPSLEIAKGSVRWANEYEFGLHIDHVSPATATRIAGLLNRHARARREDL